MDNVFIDGVEYAPVQRSVGKRAVIVVDRGWIFAGDVEEKDGTITLTRVSWPMSWSSVGFDGMLRDPKSASVKLRQLDQPVVIPSTSVIFRVPVSDDWGL